MRRALAVISGLGMAVALAPGAEARPTDVNVVNSAPIAVRLSATRTLIRVTADTRTACPLLPVPAGPQMLQSAGLDVGQIGSATDPDADVQITASTPGGSSFSLYPNIQLTSERVTSTDHYEWAAQLLEPIFVNVPVAGTSATTSSVRVCIDLGGSATYASVDGYFVATGL